MKEYDVGILGGGPGGYVAAIRAAKSGFSVAIIEGDELGGTCLNRGCIPSKTLLKHAELINQFKNSSELGIETDNITLNLSKMLDRKNKVIKQLNNGIKELMRQNKIDVYKGFGNVKDASKIEIKAKEEKTIKAKNIILATGSEVLIPDIPGIKDVNIHTSDTIFDLQEIPEQLIIVGGGVIGLEIACIFNSFGTEVQIVEMTERIMSAEDKDATDVLQEELENIGVTFHVNTEVTHFEKSINDTVVHINKKGEILSLNTTDVLISVGRKPNKTGLEELPIEFDCGFVKVDENLQTTMPNVYAIGDVIGGYQLAHAASNEGVRVIKHIEKVEKNHIKPLIPRCVYTFPEVASVGMSEEEAIKAGYRVKVKKVDLVRNGKAIASNETKGFMKIISEERYNEILGVVMVGNHVTEMISQATAFMHLEGTVEEIEEMVLPHPTISEAMYEAANSYLEKGIHYV